jgi:hypothetical protein
MFWAHQSESSDGLVWLVPYLGPFGRSDHDVLDAELPVELLSLP